MNSRRFFSNIRKYLRWTVSVFLLTATLPSISNADYTDNPPPIPGWTHATTFAAGHDSHGLYLSGGDVSYSSPAVADIDDYPSDGLETAVGGADGMLYVYKSDGSLLWSAALPNHSCSATGNSNKLLSSPAVGKLFGNGVSYVVVGYGGIGGKACGGGVSAYRGADGAPAWNFDLKKFAKKAKFGTNSNSVFSSPAIADTDGDGKMEIGFGSYDRNVYLLEADGSVRWYYNAADTVWSSPAFANVDSDPQLEMIIGTDISANKFLRPQTKNGGFVYAFKTKKPKNAHIGFRNKLAYVWQTYLPQTMYSSPIIADVLPNPGLEVLIGSGCYFPEGSKDKDGKWVKILSLKTGQVLQTLNTTACLSSTPAVGDLDDDGKLEVVATVNGNSRIGDSHSRVMAWKPESSEPIWSIIPYERGRNDSNGGTFTSPVIADVDGNGSLEVVVANNSSVGIYNGRDGSALTCQDDSCGSNPFMLYAGAYIRGTPAIADVNGDGILDIVVGTAHQSGRNNGMLFGWTDLAGLLSSPNGAQAAYSSPWPMYRGNASHTGVGR